MTREIKFRAWIPDIQRMYQVMSVDVEPQDGRQKYVTCWEHPCVKSAIIKGKVAKFRLGDGVELMQYTGLKDKNGVEIYEGDVLETPFEYTSSHPYSDEEDSSGKYRGLTHYRPSKGFIQIRVLELNDDDDCWRKRRDLEIRQSYTKVIGNIHENPELLNG